MTAKSRSIILTHTDLIINEEMRCLPTEVRQELFRYYQTFKEAAISTDIDRLQTLLERELKPYCLTLSPPGSIKERMELLYEALSLNVIRSHSRYRALSDFITNEQCSAFVITDPTTLGSQAAAYPLFDNVFYKMDLYADYIQKAPLRDGQFLLFPYIRVSNPRPVATSHRPEQLSEELSRESGVILLFRQQEGTCPKRQARELFTQTIVDYMERLCGSQDADEC